MALITEVRKDMIKSLNSINEKPIGVQSRAVVPDLFGTRDQSHGRQSFQGPGQGVCVGGGGGVVVVSG